MEIRLVDVCAECRVHWSADHESPGCTMPTHRHQRMELHRHQDVVSLPDGASITAVSYDAAAPYTRGRPPDYGLYLDHHWQPPWRHDHLDWPDFGVPENAGPLIEALDSVLARARNGELVEVGCLGGHGRTGTALACLAILSGQSAETAVTWVRTNTVTRPWKLKNSRGSSPSSIGRSLPSPPAHTPRLRWVRQWLLRPEVPIPQSPTALLHEARSGTCRRPSGCPAPRMSPGCP